MFTECDCVDWTYLLDRITLTSGAFTGTLNLKQVLQWIQGFVAPYGFILDPTQVDGPTAKVKGFEWERKYVSSALQDLTVWSGGYVFKVSPDMVWKMELPTMAETAPFAITDDTSQVQGIELNWTDSNENYAERVIGVFGGKGEREVTEDGIVTPAIVAQGYVETGARSTPTGGVRAWINNVERTVGAAGSGSQLVWNYKTHRLSPGTFVPSLNDTWKITFTGIFPFEKIADAGVTNPITYTEKFDDIIEGETAQAMVQGKLEQMFQKPRTFEIDAMREGAVNSKNYFEPGLNRGQVIAIHSEYRSSLNKLALITNCDITIKPGKDLEHAQFWYHAQGTTGIYQGGGGSFWSKLSSGSQSTPQLSVTFSEGVNPAEIPTTASFAPFLQWPIHLGGSLSRPIASVDWIQVVDAIPFYAPRDFVGRLRVWAAVKGGSDLVTVYRPMLLLSLSNRVTTGSAGAGGTVNVRLRKTSGTPVVVAELTAPIDTATPTMNVIEDVEFELGQSYVLEQKSSDDDVWTYAHGVIEPVSI
jgi:hypothetical protein